MTANSKKKLVPNFIPDGSQVGQLLRDIHENVAFLAGAEAWPSSLKTATQLILQASQPMAVWWGRSLVAIYNDACASLLGSHHPAALGHPAAQGFGNLWQTMSPYAEQILTEGHFLKQPDLKLVVEDSQGGQEICFEVSYSPLFEADAIAGVVGVFVEKARQVVRDRQPCLSEDSQQTETALRLSEERYRSIFELTGVAIWEEDFTQVHALIKRLTAENIVDLRAYFTAHPEIVQQALESVKIWDVNQQALKMFGANTKADLLQSLKTIFTPEAMQVFVEEMLAMANQQRYYEAETILKTLQGERINVLLTVTFPESDLGYSRVLVTLLDITGRKQAEQAVRESEEQFRRMAETVRDVFWISIPSEKQLLYVSPAYEEIWGRSRTELYAHYDQWINAIHPDDQERIRQTFYEQASGGEYDQEYRIIRPDGSIRWVRDRSFPIREEGSQQIHRVAGITEDITERKFAEASLRFSEVIAKARAEELEILMEITPVGLWIAHDPECQDITANQTAYQFMQLELGSQITGATPQHPFPFHFKRLRNGEEVPSEDLPLQKAIRTQQEVIDEIEFLFEDGTSRHLYGKAVPLHTETGGIRGAIAAFVDITERKRWEQALWETQERLLIVQDQAPIGICEIDFEGRFLQVNERLCQITGYDRAALLNYRIQVITHPDDVSDIPSSQLPAVDVPYYKFEQRFIHKNGHQIWVEFYEYIVRDANGNPSFKVGIIQDITARKLAENTLKQREEELRLITNALPVLITYVDQDQRYRFGNRTYEQWFGSPAIDFCGKHVREVIGETAYTKVQPYIEQVLSGQPISFEDQITYPTGRTRYVSATYIPQHDRQGRIEGFVGLVSDISDRKHSEEVLRTTLQKLDYHMYNTPLAVIEWDSNLCVARWSPSCERIFGWKAEEILGKHIADWPFVPQEDMKTVIKAAKRLERSQQPYIFCSNRNYTKDGKVVHFEWYNSSLRDESGKMLSVLSLGLDVTDRKRAELEREQALDRERSARQDAEQANQLKDQFLAVLSHELRSPLNPILGWTKLLQSGRLDAQKTTYALQTIERNAQLQTQLIEDLLDVSRILRGKMSLNITQVNLVSTIQSAIETVRLAAEAKAIEVQLTVCSFGLENNASPTVSAPRQTSNFTIRGDSARLQQVVWNLLSNAVKFSSQGGRIEVRLEQIDGENTEERANQLMDSNPSQAVSFTPFHSYAQLTVTDNGKGISPEFLPYVFDHFRQADSATTRQFGGLGLGLAIVRHLIELHGGTVSATSPGQGAGATFTVKLPLQKQISSPLSSGDTASQALNLSANSDKQPSPDPLLTDLRILVVDDEADMRNLTRFLLQERGANVEVASSATEALELFNVFNPHILISDIGLPRVDGYTLIQKIRNKPTHQGGQIPAIALSAYAGEHNRQKSLAAGFQQHLSKPIEPEKLVSEIVHLANSPRVQ